MTNATHAHLDDGDAAAYALGALDVSGATRINELAATCDVCASRLGEAEATVAQLAEPRDVPLRAVARARSPWLAIAAAFVIGLLPSAYFLHRANDDANVRAVALSALVHSHFLHAPFAQVARDAPHAKAIYARDGSWIYVVSDAPRALAVVAEPGNVVLGTLAPTGNAATLFVARPAHAQTLELHDGARTIARARL